MVDLKLELTLQRVMQMTCNNVNWTIAYRRYLAFRQGVDLERALAAAPHRLVDFLDICRSRQFQRAKELLGPIVESLPDEGGSEDCVTVHLAYLDPLARLCSSYTEWPPDQWNRLLQTGIRASQLAIDYAAGIPDPACFAHYAAELAAGLRAAGDSQQAVPLLGQAVEAYESLEGDDSLLSRTAVVRNLDDLAHACLDLHNLPAARDAYLKSAGILRELAAGAPQIHWESLAQTLNNLGVLHADLHEPEASRDAFHEAYAIYRELAGADPDGFQLLLATALNNLGTAFWELREFQEARNVLQETLHLLNGMSSNPDLCRPRIAAALNNLGNTHRALQEPELARSAYEKSVAIRRQLAETAPDRYLPELARTLSNLGNLFRQLRELEHALGAYQEALEIHRELARRAPDHRRDVASTLNNLANLRDDLLEYALARDTYLEAVVIQRELARAEPDVYEKDLALMLSNLGNVFSEVGEPLSAREAYEEALALYRHLAAARPIVYSNDVATMLNNLGAFFRRTGELDLARGALLEALEIRRRLAEGHEELYPPCVSPTLENLGMALQDRPEGEPRPPSLNASDLHGQLLQIQRSAYGADAAGTLVNFGKVLVDISQLPLAREIFERVIEIYHWDSLWVEAAFPRADLGRAEKLAGNMALAIDHFELALSDLHRGLKLLASSEHHDKFKARFDDVVAGLIGTYATTPALAGDGLRLAGLLESLRRHNLLGETDSLATRLLQEVQDGRGELAGALKRIRGAFLWVQAVDDAVVFVTVRAGRTTAVRTAPKAWLALFETLLGHVRDLIGSSELAFFVEHPEAFPESVPDMTIRKLMSRAFDMLPPDVQDVFRGNEICTVFTSACPDTIDFPLEFLLVPETSGARSFAGLRTMLVRAHGLQELSAVLGRKPVMEGRTVVIGDPDTGVGAMPRGDHIFRAAKDVERLLDQAGAPAESAFANQATREWALDRLRDPRLRLFIFQGHGSANAMEMAAGERVSLADLGGISWQGSPFLHLNCCSAGENWGWGGGRFVGLPAAALECGASAVLASSHPLYERPAAAFTAELYDSLLNAGNTLGVALLRARRKIGRDYGGNPLLWATSSLWGNPEIVLAHRSGTATE